MVVDAVDRVAEIPGHAAVASCSASAESGSYAEQALGAVDRLARRPLGLSWELAAALPVAATTAHHVLDQLDLAAGQTIVIDGAAGGVGTLAVIG